MCDPLPLFENCKRFHLIGIGGIGMSGLAELLLRMGYAVSGSDLRLSALTDRLRRLGAHIHEGHDASHIGNADTVVYSSAVAPDNPERAAAKRNALLTIPRADLLAAFLYRRESVAVAGTHGKTTTSALIGSVMMEARLDPTLIIGGVLPVIQSNVRFGNSKYVVAEADEYDRSFLALSPRLAVITTVDADHLEYYRTLEAVDQAFISFANAGPFYRPVVLCADDPGIRRIRPHIRRRQIGYGLESDAEVKGVQVSRSGLQTEFEVQIRGAHAGTIRLQKPGRHMILNALAAVAVADFIGIPFEHARSALAAFSGVARRFEIKGVVNKITVIDDYAHHPAEIAATLEGVRHTGAPRIVAVFQPHLFTRTRDFADAFGEALARAHMVVVTDVYPSREKLLPGVTGELIASAVERHGGQDVLYIPKKTDVTNTLVKRLKPGDTVVTMGAGDVTEIADSIISALKAGRHG